MGTVVRRVIAATPPVEDAGNADLRACRAEWAAEMLASGVRADRRFIGGPDTGVVGGDTVREAELDQGAVEWGEPSELQANRDVVEEYTLRGGEDCHVHAFQRWSMPCAAAKLPRVAQAPVRGRGQVECCVPGSYCDQ